MHLQQNEDPARIIELFKQIQQRFRRKIMEIPEVKSMTMPQIILIHILFEHPGITLTELSRHMSLAKSTVSGIVDRLEDQGLVERHRPEDNRRTVCLKLTEACDRKKDSIMEIKKAYTLELLSKGTPEEIRGILEGLETLNRLLEE